MAKKATHTVNGVMPNDAKTMIKTIKSAARVSRKEIGLYMALKFITCNRERMNGFKKYTYKNQSMVDQVANLIRKHEKGTK